jgi:hypothetical protein
MTRSATTIAGIMLLCLALPAPGKVSMRVSLGWDGVYRTGRWAPIFITLADPDAQPARNVLLSFLAPHDNAFAMQIRSALAIGPEPRTVVLYAPLTWQLDDTVVMVLDGNTGRRLAVRSLDPSGGTVQSSYTYAADRSEFLMGVSGRRTQPGLQGDFSWSDNADANLEQNRYGQRPQIRTGFLDPQHLPDTLVGYDSLDVLLLNGVGLLEVRPEQQQAMADWVRSGGRLLLWPGTSLLPEDSPLVKLLPCSVGLSGTINLSLDDTRQLALASRVDKLASRELAPLPSARKLDVLRGKGQVYLARAGLGTVGVLSFDPSQLLFEQSDPSNAKDRPAVRFWRPILKQLSPRTELKPNEYSYYVRPEEGRRLVAMEAVVNRLGDVPGVGTFDFSYIAIVMAAMMFVVGPIDWFVLKKLGKQPWTWVTTSGWIAMVTFGALYIGYLFRSGDLHYRTVRLIDQADGQVVGDLDVAGIYSPRTQNYLIDGPRDLWWEPANIDAPLPWRRTQKIPTTLLMQQDREGNRPGPMPVNVWSLRFMTAQSADPQDLPPPIEAHLSRSGNMIRGTIRNNTSGILKNLCLRARDGVATEDSQVIKAGQTSEISWPLRKNDDSLTPPKAVPYQPFGYSQNNAYGHGVRSFLLATCDLASDRSDRIETLLAADANLACLYAESEEVAPAIKLQHRNVKRAIEKHYEVVRALVELK